MIISKKLQDAINTQIGNELGASLQYLQIAAYFDAETLPNLTQFFFLQSDEERAHAMKFLHYLLEVGAQVAVPAVAAPKVSFSSAEEAVGAALKWEKEVTQQIYDLVEIANEEKDFISQRFLDYYVVEQLEEISMMDTLLNMVKKAGDKNMFMLDNHVLALRAPEGE
ncbi:MAG: ferritin [Anaerolineaceae bacterium]|jgi:ferritin|nr:ferritin [Anaerolineaceae bacterium]